MQGLHEAPSFEHFTTNLYTQPVSTTTEIKKKKKKSKLHTSFIAFKDIALLNVTALCGLNLKNPR